MFNNLKQNLLNAEQSVVLHKEQEGNSLITICFSYFFILWHTTHIEDVVTPVQNGKRKTKKQRDFQLSVQKGKKKHEFQLLENAPV